jgi:Mg2+/Co2+ transporter CorB
VANNFINIGVVILFSFIGKDIFYHFTGVKIHCRSNPSYLLLLLFGEVLPKVYASRNNIKFAKMVAYPVAVLDKPVTNQRAYGESTVYT